MGTSKSNFELQNNCRVFENNFNRTIERISNGDLTPKQTKPFNEKEGIRENGKGAVNEWLDKCIDNGEWV